jgi:hypothetical protein
MAKIKNPIRLSEYFHFEGALLEGLGVLNPTLNVDTRLFIDPLLLGNSGHPEINTGARTTYRKHFETIVALLAGSKEPNDAPWRGALRLLSFPEIKGTCLGYGAQSAAGSGSGEAMRENLIRTGKEIVDLGVREPDLFIAMALFEEGFGPDLISDMTTNVILGDLLAFNERILAHLPIPRQNVTLRLQNGNRFEVSLPINPFMKAGDPVILVPLDILRALPVASDWSDVEHAASQNEQIRNLLNAQIADFWKIKTLREKDKLRQWALSGKDEFHTLIEMIHAVPPIPYDSKADPEGEIFWRTISAKLAEREPLEIKQPANLDLAGVTLVVTQIVEQFRFLVEARRFSEELYYENKPRPERAAQRLFFAVAYAYCKANNLDITPEAETGNGPVDFKVSSGFTGRVLVEIKLSTNDIVKGYSRQLETYKAGEETSKGFYIVIDVGQMGEKDEALLEVKNLAASRGEPVSDVIFIDGARKPSASKL